MSEPKRDATVAQYLRSIIASEVDSASDDDLVTRFVERRDADAFELLLWRHAGMVQKVCREITRDYHIAEDACQAVFLLFARQAASIRDRRKVASWLYRTAFRVSMRVRKRRDRHQTISLDLTSLNEIPESHMSADQEIQELRAQLIAAIMRLPDKYRHVVILCYIEGLTYAEAAKRLGLPIGTIAAQASRAKAALQRHLTPNDQVKLTALLASILCTSADISAKFVATTTRAALCYAAGQTTETGATAMTLTLLNEMRTAMLRATVLRVCCGAFFLGTLVTLGMAISNSAATRQDPILPSAMIEWTVPTAAAPQVRRKTIDSSVVVAWERLGAIYGGFEFEDRESLFKDSAREKPVLPTLCRFSTRRAETMIPGFYIPPESDAAAKLAEFPLIEGEFAIDLRDVTLNEEALRSFLKKQTPVALLANNLDGQAIELLSKNQRIRYLEIEGNSLTDDLISQLARCRELTHLMITSNAMTDEGINKIASLPRLRMLALSGRLLGNGVLTAVNSGHLQSLLLQAPQLNDDGLKEIEKSHIEFLALRSNALNGTCLESIARMPRLHTLEIHSPVIVGKHFEALKASKGLSELRFVCQNDANDAIKALVQMKGLRRLDVVYSDMDDRVLPEFAKMPCLEQLRIFSVMIDGSGLKSLADVRTLQELQVRTEYDEKPVDLTGVKAWKQLPNLRHLSLSSHQLSDIVTDLTEFESLFRLEIDGRPELSSEQIKRLGSLKNLSRLDLKREIPIANIEPLLALPQLHELGFHCTTLDDDCLQKLDIPKNLQTLRIFGRKSDLPYVAKWASRFNTSEIEFSWQGTNGFRVTRRYPSKRETGH